jgi:hypothetical protein
MPKLCCVLNPHLECEACGIRVCIEERDKEGNWLTWKLHDYVDDETYTNGKLMKELMYECPTTKIRVITDYSVKHLRFKRII